MTSRRLPTWLGMAVLAAVLIIVPSSVTPTARASHAAPATEHRTATPIKHFITLLQENHTFDNYFGTFPGADGIPPDTCMPRDPDQPEAGCVAPFRMAGRPALDLNHSRAAFEGQYRGGAMDGFVAAQNGEETVMGYYDDEDLPYYWNMAEEFVLFDRFFSSSSGGSVVNHMYWVAGGPGPRPDSIPDTGIDVLTIFDRLEEAGVSWKFYVQNYDPTITFRNLAGQGDRASQVVWVPLLTMPRYIDDPHLSSHIVDLDEYFDDLINDSLPAVSYIIPSGASEHPPGSLRSGQRFVQTLVNSLVRSSAWDKSAFLLSYDDWGGWYDHVPPPQVDEWGYGFRVPALLFSAYARQGVIDSTELDFTSMLRFIEYNWNVEPLAERDAAANLFLGAMDFSSPPRAPFFVSGERAPPAEYAEPNRLVIYGAYASSMSIAVLLIIAAWVNERRSKGRRSGEIRS